MLESLTIRQIALIDDVTIRFHEGMHVLTGETGAGKSIVVDSVNLILGGRADRDMIRTGCDKASVEAVFDTRNNSKAAEFLAQEGIEYDGRTLSVYREISTGGRNICRVCGVIIPVSRLKDLSAALLDLHGQSEHQFLTDPDRQLAFLDQTGGTEHQELLRRTEADHNRFMDNHRAYAKLVRENEHREERMRSLARDLEELRKAHVEPGEADSLLDKRKRLSEAEKLSSVLQTVRDSLSGGDDRTSALGQVKEASGALRSIADKDESFREISERCEGAYLELEDIAYQISQICGHAEYEPGALEKTDDRLALIHRLERKYSADADDLQAILKKTEEEYLHLAELEESISRMSSEHKSLLAAYRNTARELTASRQKIAAAFETRMMKELRELGMENTRFSVEFKANDTGRPLMPTARGDDRIEFMISPNPGEPLKPLARIASGGELSRLMLAVKTLESAHSGVESMVFDEIDTGISGRMAQVVAEKMITISRERQVICVTHLPQIAAAADYHYLVRKTVSEGRTNTSVSELDQAGRTEEVGRMISGADGITDDTNAYASSLLNAAEAMKRSL